jgi:hypothetical protein
MSGFAGNGPKGAGRVSRFQFTAAAGRTVFSGIDDNGLTLKLTPGLEMVIFKGRLLPPSDYAVTSSSITLPAGVAANDVLYVIAPAVQNVSNSYDKAQDGADISDKGKFRSNLGVPGANALINSDLRINQRAYASGAALAAGAYGHDRWKAGAGGCTYTFAQGANGTQITIAAGSLIQVVEDKNVDGGAYVLSWTGTAQARVGVNSATPSGAYSTSPLIITGQNVGTVMSIEFNAGTLARPKLELGVTPTPFVMLDYTQEIVRCLRYFCQLRLAAQGLGPSQVMSVFLFPVPMRASPTNSNVSPGTFGTSTFVGLTVSDNKSGYVQINAQAANSYMIDRVENFSAEL